MHNISKRSINTSRSDHHCEINVFPLALDWGLNRHPSPGKLQVFQSHTHTSLWAALQISRAVFFHFWWTWQNAVITHSTWEQAASQGSNYLFQTDLLRAVQYFYASQNPWVTKLRLLLQTPSNWSRWYKEDRRKRDPSGIKGKKKEGSQITPLIHPNS